MKSQYQGGFLMAKIRQVGGRISERLMKDHGIEINSAQGRIMFALWQQDSVSINELAGKTQLKKSTLTSMLDRLENMGYIKRQRCRDDRRKILIQRTAKDKDLESKYVRVSQEITRIFYDGLTSAEIDRFEHYLTGILENLTRYEAKLKNKP